MWNCSGQVAVITPCQVFSGFGQQCVIVVGATKHHSIIATVGEEVYTWGSNRGKWHHDLDSYFDSLIKMDLVAYIMRLSYFLTILFVCFLFWAY